MRSSRPSLGRATVPLAPGLASPYAARQPQRGRRVLQPALVSVLVPVPVLLVCLPCPTVRTGACRAAGEQAADMQCLIGANDRALQRQLVDFFLPSLTRLQGGSAPVSSRGVCVVPWSCSQRGGGLT